MATVVWIGGSHNWSAGAAWVGGVPPTAADDVLVGTGVGGSTTGTLTVDGTAVSPSLCRSIDCTNFTGTLLATGTGHVLQIGDASGGSMKLVAGMTLTIPTDAGTYFNFVSTKTGNTIEFGAHQTPNFKFDGAGGSWLLQSNTVMFNGAASFMTLINGTLDLNGHNLTTMNFSSVTGGTRVLNMGTGTLQVGISGGLNMFWNVGDLSSGLTINGNTSTFLNSFANISLTMGDQTYHDFTQNATGAFGPIITGSPTFNNFTANSANVTSGINITDGSSITVNGTLNLTGNSFSQNTRILIKSTRYGRQASIICNGTVTVTRIDFKDIAASGSASWNIASVTGNSGDCGNNTGITFTTPGTFYAVMTTSGNIDGLPWKTTSGGAGVGRVPLPQDTGVFDANSFSTTGIVVSSNASRVGGLNFTGSTNSPTLNMNNVTEMYGNLVLISGMSVSGTQSLNIEGGAGTTSITTAGKSLTFPLAVGSNRTLRPVDAIVSTNTLKVFDYAILGMNGFNHQFSAATFSGGTTTIDTTLTLTAGVTINNLFSNAPTIVNVKAGGTLACGTTFTQTGGSCYVYPGGSITWGTGSNWVFTPDTLLFKTYGQATWSGHTLTVAQDGSFTFGG